MRSKRSVISAERLAVLYGNAAKLECGPAADGGYEAVLVVPRNRGREW
jgi:hypothetical protein